MWREMPHKQAVPSWAAATRIFSSSSVFIWHCMQAGRDWVSAESCMDFLPAQTCLNNCNTLTLSSGHGRACVLNFSSYTCFTESPERYCLYFISGYPAKSKNERERWFCDPPPISLPKPSEHQKFWGILKKNSEFALKWNFVLHDYGMFDFMVWLWDGMVMRLWYVWFYFTYLSVSRLPKAYYYQTRNFIPEMSNHILRYSESVLSGCLCACTYIPIDSTWWEEKPCSRC